MNNSSLSHSLIELKEIIEKRLYLTDFKIGTKRKIIGNFFEFLIAGMLDDLVKKKHAYYEDVNLESFDNLAKIYISVFGKEEFSKIFWENLNQFKNKIENK